MKNHNWRLTLICMRDFLFQSKHNEEYSKTTRENKKLNLVECNNVQRTRRHIICAYENFQYILQKSHNLPSLS